MSIGDIKLQQVNQPPQSINCTAQQHRQIYSIATSSMMASQTHSGGTATSVAQQNAQGVQQQLHLQQPTTTTTIQGAHQAGAHNQMQPLQVIQQPLQNPTLMPHQFFNTQGQLLMPGNIAFHPGLNPQIQQAQITPSIQVIAAGKTLQPNQLSAPHMFTAATSYTTIPTSASSNQAYIITHPSHPSILQQQQTTKPGEMQKVIQPQIGTTAQIPTQSIWAIPQYLNQNSILIRGTQPDQMFIQQQQLHNNTSTHQQFTTMPLTAGQLPATSISSATTNGVQQVTQQQAQMQAHNQQQSQSQQGQPQNQTQIATSNIVSIKAPATLQPKPPLQIQPQPAPSQNVNQNQHQAQQNQHVQQQQQNQQLQQHQSQQLSQLQQVAMAHQSQVQMLNQATSQNNLLQQQILTQTTQGLTAQVMQQAQQGLQQRQLTILPQGASQQIQSQPVTLIQQQPQHQQSTTQQPQPIRPNYSTGTVTNTTQSQGITTTVTPTQRPKIRKPGAGRGNTNASPTQQGKTMAPRPAFPISPMSAPLLKPAPAPQQPVGATLTKVSIPSQLNTTTQSTPVNNQPLKTINIAALHTPPNLPDATLTPLMPQATSQGQGIQQPPPPQPVQMFPATTTQLPSPNISITPAPPPKKEEVANEITHQTPPSQQHQSQQNHSSQHNAESKGENEKENTKTDTTNEDSEEGSGKQKLPKALVKPQVLTHVIEGFVIQEASEPFPLGRSGDSDEPPIKKVALSAEMGKCEMCGKVDLRAKFKKNKRFCSSQCAKGMKAQQHQQSTQLPTTVPNSAMNHINDNRQKPKGKKLGEGDSELTDETSSSAGEPSILSPSQDNLDDEPKVNPVRWNVSEVVDFVRSLPGCSEYADDFAVQEIDGQALMLLKEDHLMSAMGMKLGPALKLCAKIEVIKAGMNSANGDGNQGKS